MVLAGEPGHEERNRLVAHELVDEAVPLVDDAGRRPVEARDETGELLRLHLLRERRRAADVGEHERELDLGAARPLVDRAEARTAETAIQLRRAESERLEEDTSRRPERGETELAPRARGDLPEDGPDVLQLAEVAVQDRTPRLLDLRVDIAGVLVIVLGDRVGHRRIVEVSARTAQARPHGGTGAARPPERLRYRRRRVPPRASARRSRARRGRRRRTSAPAEHSRS